MTSHDVRDMLDLPGEAAPRPAKKQKLAAPRPVLKGLAREVQNLGGDNPIAIVPEVSVFKKKRFGSRKPAAKWENRSFKNSAREDETLVLKHWRRKDEPSAAPSGEEGAAAQENGLVEDSTFAKYNVKVITPQYDDDQYQRHLQDHLWTKDETDYLVSLARNFDLRWPIIWDRYEYQPPAINLDPQAAEVAIDKLATARTLEDLKARYYMVASTMMKVHKPPESMNQAEFNLLELMQNFNPQQEKLRKQFAEAAFSRTKEEAREEESLLIELKRILARSDKLAEERKELYARLEAPPSTGNIGVFTSSQGLQQLLHQLMTADKSKKRRSIMGPDGTSPAGPSGMNQQPSFDRRESSVRESISGPSGSSNNNKKGPTQPGQTERRQLSPEEMQLYGVKILDRIPSSGPTFRSERLNKPITSKSSVQQQKMLSVLTELGVPHRLIMPTTSVGESYDALLSGIVTLLDQRKVLEKIQGEINTIKEKKRREEEERAARMNNFGGDGADDRDVKVEETEREKSAAPSVSGRSGQHKRSASVLSAVSDKSTKRQKK